MAVGRKAGWVTVQGGDAAAMSLTDATNSTYGTVIPLPYFNASGFSKTVNEETINTESGNLSFTRTTGTDHRVTFTFMQQDADLINALNNDWAGNYYAVAKLMNDDAVDGVYQFYVFPKVKPNGSVSLSAPGGELSVDWPAEAVDTQTVIDMSTFAHSTFPVTLTGNATIPAGKAFVAWEISE